MTLVFNQGLGCSDNAETARKKWFSVHRVNSTYLFFWSLRVLWLLNYVYSYLLEISMRTTHVYKYFDVLTHINFYWIGVMVWSTQDLLEWSKSIIALTRCQEFDDWEICDCDHSISPNRIAIARCSCYPIWKTIVLNEEEIEEYQDCYWDENCKKESHSQCSHKNFEASLSPRSVAFFQSSHAPFISSISFFTWARLKNLSESLGWYLQLVNSH